MATKIIEWGAARRMLTQSESDIGPTPVSGHGNDRDHRPKQNQNSGAGG
jgi:hypothetical protein